MQFIKNLLQNVVKESEDQIRTIIPQNLLAAYLSVLYKDVINNQIMTTDEFKRVMNKPNINLMFNNLKRLIVGNQ